MTEMIPAAPAPMQSARTAPSAHPAGRCPAGHACTPGRPGDHLARYQGAEPARPVSRDQLAAGAGRRDTAADVVPGEVLPGILLAPGMPCSPQHDQSSA